MEIDYRLTKQQKQWMDTFAKLMGNGASWVLTRHQGTGLRFWRITWTVAPEWAGEQRQREGKTLLEAINLVLATR